MPADSFRHVVADIETDGLLDELTVVHSLVLRDVETGRVQSCTDEGAALRPDAGYLTIAEGLALLQRAERIYVHNGIRFDIPALRKVYPDFTVAHDVVRDTFIIACMRWAHIKPLDYKRAGFPKHLAGSHALEAWGYRLGVHKGEYTHWCKEHGIDNPWAAWCQEMQTYCEGDTATTLALVQQIRKAGVSPESVEIEHTLAWYLAAQERAGVPFDIAKAQELQATLAARREALADQLRTEMGPVVKYKPFVPTRDNAKLGYVKGQTFQKVITEQFNPASRPHIAKKLKEHFGWEPTEFTENGQPKVDEKTLQGLNADIPAVKLLSEYLLVEKRLGQVSEGKEAWLRHARRDGPAGGALTGLYHIHGRVKQNHAITHRAAHAKPNLSQVPKVGKSYGAECRELFFVPECPGLPEEDQWVLVGADASSLEARCLAHYMARYDDGAYGRLLLEGDVHTANRIALGLPGEPEIVSKVARDGAKTWYYAFMYGGGDLKLGSLLAFLQTPDGVRLLPVPPGGWTPDAMKSLGKQKKLEFLKNTPALKRLIQDVQHKGKAIGYVLMPDGRRTYIRSEHAALNSLLQSSGAILVKRWIANFSPKLWQSLGEPGWDRQWVPLLWSHDEVQIAVRKRHAAEMQHMLVAEMRAMTTHFQWRVQLDGEAKCGANWKDTH